MPKAAKPKPKKVELTEAEYQALLAKSATQTITVDAAEYAKVTAQAAELPKILGERDRYMQRTRELETALSRERKDHQDELGLALKTIQKLKGGAG